MKRRVFRAIALISLVGAAVAAKSPVSREVMQLLEKKFDGKIQRFSIEDPILLLGNTRGFYLEGYGVLFTAEVNLVPVAISPFHQKLTPDQAVRLHAKKLERLPILKGMMQETLMDYAAALDNVPADEKIGLGVSLFHFSQENNEGIPSQILMEAQRKTLADFKAGRIDRSALAEKIVMREF